MTAVCRIRRGIAALLAAAWLVPPIVPGAEVEPPLAFHRVHVPRGRLPDVPLGAGRYVPMSLAEFEQAVGRLRPPGAGDVPPPPRAERSRYELTADDSGRLSGRVVFEVGTDAARDVREIDLGAVRPGRCTLRTAGGTGDAVVFGRGSGTVAVKVSEPGTYECELSVGPQGPSAPLFTLPLVPALATTVVVRPPPGLRPAFAMGAVGRSVPRRGAGGNWQIEVGPAAAATIAFVAEAPEPAGIAAWTDVAVRGGVVDVVAALVPRPAWTTDDVTLDIPATLRIVAMRLAADERPLDWTTAADGRACRIRLPAAEVGGGATVIVHGVAPLDAGADWQVPLVRPAPAAWAGGGVRVEVDAAFGVVGVAAPRCRAVTPEVAERWPLPADTSGRARGPAAGVAMRPAVLHFEQQAAEADLALTLRPRRPQLDVARVTTVDLSPGQVLGRATCDVRVITGETFTLAARVAPGWLIDTVEVLEPFDLVPTEGDADDRRRPVAGDVEWRITRGRDGTEELRIGLAVAATPARSLGLRVVGHRRGVPLGSGFRTADMDMVRFEGEAADAAAIDFNVGPEALVEIDGQPLGVFAVPARLARLVEPGTLRGRLPGGEQAGGRAARLVQRRPPLDARVTVRLAARDERLSESFTFSCRPEAAAVDSVVVHFSEPMGEALEWSLLEPVGGSLLARRLDAADTARGEGGRIPGCAESWLVEVTPAFFTAVTIRAARDVPFLEPQPVPLAWVEGATTARGSVLVRDTGPARPTIVNRRLRELPPPPAGDGQQPTVAEFTFAVPQAGAEAGAPADLVPTAGHEARAWAWREAVTCWCHESGRTACAVAYDIENHGREQLTVHVPAGRRVEEVLLDGVSIPVESLAAVGAVRVPLPTLRRRLTLVVRTLVDEPSSFGFWRIDPACCGIDMPVLDQQVTLLLPPDLEVAGLLGGYRDADPPVVGWQERLSVLRTTAPSSAGAAPAPVLPEPDVWPTGSGWRARKFVPTSGRTLEGIVVVRRRVVTAVALGCGFLACVAVLVTRRVGAAVLLAAVAAAAALWLDPPGLTVARAAWWGALAGCGWRLAALGTGRRSRVATLLAVAAAAVPGIAAAQPGAGPERPLEVFITPGDDGGMALVPEPLFRTLLRDGRPTGAAVRIVRCRVRVDEGPLPAPWRLVLDVDADAGGVLVLDQAADAARWQPPPQADDRLQVQEEGRRLRLLAPVGGSQRYEVRVVPAIERRGRLETATIRLPPAGVTRLEVVDAAGAAVVPAPEALQCDRSVADGPFLRVREPAGDTGFDLSGAGMVRLVRPIDRRDTLAAADLVVTSENDLDWGLAGCRVRARFDIAGDALVRAVVVAADAALVPAEESGADGQTVTSLGGSRYLVERPLAEPGPSRIRLAFQMPLADPVGVFPVPGVWLEGSDADTRTVRLLASPDLDARLESATPPGTEPRDDVVNAAGDLARYEAGRNVAAQPRLRLGVSREAQEIRGSQSLAVSLDADGFGLRLQARIDATSTPVMTLPVEVPPGCDIERVTLREDDLAAPDAGARPPLDVQWSLPTANVLTVVVQQPRAGRYRLEVDGRLRLRPAARGRLPLLRAALAGSTPLVVTWRQGGPQAPPETAEVPPGAAAPPYELAADSPAAEPPRVPPVAAAVPAAGEDRVEQARVAAVIDDRGRLRGIACYDIVSSRSVIRVQLPPRARLFDVLLDGRDVTARPVAADAWEVPVYDAAWPRALSLVFAGDIDPSPGAGRPFQLSPPVIADLPCAAVMWTITPPPGRELRVAPPARPLAAAEWQANLAAGRERIRALFDRASGAASPLEAERLRAFAAARTAVEPTPAAAWEQALEAGADDPAPVDRIVRLVTVGAEPLTARLVRPAEATVRERAGATLALTLAAGLAWLALRRRS